MARNELGKRLLPVQAFPTRATGYDLHATGLLTQAQPIVNRATADIIDPMSLHLAQNRPQYRTKTPHSQINAVGLPMLLV